MYLESGLKSATEFFTKLAFDEEVCSHDNLLIFFLLVLPLVSAYNS